MDSSEIPRLAYLVLLGLAVAGWFIAENRNSLGKTLRMAIIWALIFVGMVAVVGLWSDVRDDVMPRQASFDNGTRIEVPQAFDGHYYLTLHLNDTPVEFVVDTGASEVVLTQDDARRVGLDPNALAYSGRAMTANGVVETARARINEVRLGEVRDRDVTVSVNAGEMPGSLLGMSYLSRFERLEISDGRLILQR